MVDVNGRTCLDVPWIGVRFNLPGRQSGRTSMVETVPLFPKCSMYGISAYINHKFKPNLGKYTIHGAYGFGGFLNSKKRFRTGLPTPKTLKGNSPL